MIQEKAVTFGPSNKLVGVFTEGTKFRPCKKTGIIFVNCGFLHHVGPYNLYVDMARDLAAKGRTVLRFDISGLGDSPSPKSSLSFEERSARDISTAMDFFELNYGIEEFILIGICLGARNSHYTATIDKRVRGLVQIDGVSFPNLKFQLIKNLRVLSLRKWKNFIQRNFLRTFKNSKNKIPSESWKLPARDKIEKDLTNFIDEGLNLLYIFSGRFPSYNYRNQWRDLFKNVDFKDQVQVDYYPMADHTFTLLGVRKEMVQSTYQWLDEKYPISL